MITKNIVLRNGFTASHWRLAAREFNDLAKTVFLKVNGYKDAAAFVAGNEPAFVFTRLVETLALYNALDGKTVVQVETAIVNNIAEFAGGVVS